MTNQNAKRRLKHALREKLERLRLVSKELYSSISVIHSYCKYRNDSETVDNIIHMLEDTKNNAEDINRELCEILNADSQQLSAFLSRIVPLNFDDVIVDD